MKLTTLTTRNSSIPASRSSMIQVNALPRWKYRSRTKHPSAICTRAPFILTATSRNLTASRLRRLYFADEECVFVPAALFRPKASRVLKNAPRKYPVYYHYAFTEADSVVLDLPAGYTAETVAAPQSARMDFAD